MHKHDMVLALYAPLEGPSYPCHVCLLLVSGADQILQHGQEILDSLAEIKLTLMIRFEQWRANPSTAQFQSVPAPVSHLAPQHLVVAPVPLPTSVGSSQSRDSPDVVNVLSTKVGGASVNVALPLTVSIADPLNL